MFQRVSICGTEVDDPYGGIVLDVVQDYDLANPDVMHGAGRKSALLSTARLDAWARLDRAGMKRTKIAGLFGVNKAAVTVGIQRAQERALDVCPCCKRPLGDRRAW